MRVTSCEWKIEKYKFEIRKSWHKHKVKEKTKKILVIGSSGLVGSNLLHLSPLYPFTILPSFHSFFPDEYKESGLKFDITDPVSVLKGLKESAPNSVVNASCMTVAVCEREPRNAYKVQVDGVRVLARACKEFDVRLIHLSSDMVYSGNKGAPYTLDDVPDPISVYGKTKWEGERALQEVQGDYVIVRSAIVLGRGRFRKTGFLDWMVERDQKDEELPLYVDQWRSPIVVDDLVEVIFKLASSSFCGVLLAGGEEGMNRVEMGKRLLVAMGKPHDIIRPVSVDSIESGVSLQKDLRLDNSKLKEVVGKEKFMGIGEYFRRCEIID